MHAAADHELLRRYAEHGAEEAFNELVQRHLNLVWAAARRVTGNADLARDVAQTVFTDLARKAKTLPHETVLAGWLYRAACHAAAKQVRSEARRALREHHAMATQDPDSADTLAAEELQPVLDAALAELSDADRDAVVLRFLAGRSLAEVGATLGANEDAAQKRVSRALEKLREAFRRRGVNVGGGVMAAALNVAGAQAAPAGLAPGIATTALLSVGTAAGGWLWFMNMKTTIGVMAWVAAVAGLVWQQQVVSRLTADNDALHRELAKTQELAAAPAPPDTGETAKLAAERDELLRLRGEVARLRRLTTPAASDPAAGKAVPVEEVREAPPQVEIESRFVEVPDSTLAQLGLAMAQNSHAVFSGSQMKVLMRQLDQTADVDVLSAPRVVTLSGRMANISINDPAPEELDPGVVQVAGAEPATKAEAAPAKSASKPTLQLDVTPTVVAGGRNIELVVTAGYLHAIAAGEGRTGAAGFMPEAKGVLPDGHTLILRQPAQAQAIAKSGTGPRSLLVFATPVMIDPAGQRLHPDE